MASFGLQMGIILMIATILTVAIMLESSQQKPANLPEDHNAGPLKQIGIFNANHPLEGTFVMLGIVGCGSLFAHLYVRYVI